MKLGINYSIDTVKHIQLKIFNLFKYLPNGINYYILINLLLLFDINIYFFNINIFYTL